ncbi:MAG: NifU family protein [Bacteroidetes bacterium]|nr:NifU family protein [Bacteroidota bacterium]
MTKPVKELVLEALGLVRPALQQDDGDVELVSVSDDGIVEVRLLGNCRICPLSSMTLRAGIQATIRRMVPSIRRVEAVP